MKRTPPDDRDGSFPWLFFGLTFGISWALWIPFAISGQQVSLIAIALGAFAPSVVGALLASFAGDRETRRDFWLRACSFRRIGGRWYIVIFFIFPVMVALTLGIDYLIGGRFFPLRSALRTLTHPLELLTFIVMMIFGGPLAEELGWRGFALDRLQRKWNALSSSLVLGLAWGTWHLPLFFMNGTTQSEMGLMTMRFWLFFVQVMALSVLFSWVYNNTGRSTLAAILLHFMTNASITIIVELRHALPARIEIIRTIVLIVVAAIVVFAWGPRTLRGRTSATAPAASP